MWMLFSLSWLYDPPINVGIIKQSLVGFEIHGQTLDISTRLRPTALYGYVYTKLSVYALVSHSTIINSYISK
jgi:hypothetical protein